MKQTYDTRNGGQDPRRGTYAPPKKAGVSAGRAILLTFSILFLLLGGLTLFAYQYMFSPLTVRQIDRTSSALGISQDTLNQNKNSGVTNIALFGVDSRDGSDDGRSDSIMILSIDQKRNKIKLSSILRDSYVAIDGYGSQKITHAYAYGGAQLAIKTLNQNFNLDIQDYATVNFAQLADLIDAMGGIDIEITAAEQDEMNNIIASGDTGTSGTVQTIPSSGMVHLSGNQAVVYARIREQDSDNARADRQQKVLNCLFESAKSASVTELPSMVRTMMGMMETSLSTDAILGYAPFILQKPTMERTSLPDAAYETDVQGGIYGDAGWVWRYDLSGAAARLHSFIYES